MLKDYMKKRLTIRVDYEGNDYIIGRISGVMRAMTASKKRYNVATDEFKTQRYLSVDAYPWEYWKIKRVIEKEYPGKCKFFY